MTYQTTTTYPRRRPVWPWVLGAVAAIIAALCAVSLGGALGDESRRLDDPAPTVSRSPAASTTPAIAFAGEGEYRVGRDIAAGRYRTTGPDTDNLARLCVWQIATGAGRTLDTGAATGVAYLPPDDDAALVDGQLVTVAGCDPFTMV